MRPYEMVTIFQADLEDHKAAVEEIEGVVRNLGGEIEKSSSWGKRRFAYPIQKQTDGFYAVLSFSLEPSQVSELERLLKLKTQVLRHLVIALDEA
ncbi:MAG TPA: 30S ribosomal protein S6 [Synergistales bacterium]|nr:MAG: 30S ribosomal protein S6 [Synergistales bacterium 57_84]HCR38316.1 30S ribosomal protein S6 [Synergistaceae bacterium]HPA58313.1 30S ribosomal protein S6 [Synergistales bacterium]HQO83324.1 30S ribosomal protein S6 [Synergistales bacterium]HQQ10302.1 30S ribosomal protein S6 [Synergistales bacterium]